MTNIFFIHGFGEKPDVFDKIAPQIGGNQVFIDVWDELGTVPIDNHNVRTFAQKLITKYRIGINDVVIGHSMGGWIAYHIKHFTQCRIVQIASWTQFDRIISPIKSGALIYTLTRWGLYINSFQKWLFVKAYNGKPSKVYFSQVFQGLIEANKQAIVNQLMLMFEPVEAPPVQPDLRIHAKKDTVIKYPREPFHEVPGDHFTLITQPETVIAPIQKLLSKP